MGGLGGEEVSWPMPGMPDAPERCEPTTECLEIAVKDLRVMSIHFPRVGRHRVGPPWSRLAELWQPIAQ